MTTRLHTPGADDRSFIARLRDEDGSITVFSMFMFIVMLIAAGFALDVNNAMQARVKLQSAADAAGHAALYWAYKTNNVQQAESKAIELAQANMPTSVFGDVLVFTDIEWGDWDKVDRTFTPDPTNQTAVRVTTRRIAGRSNAVRTFLMHFAGFEELNLNTVSVWDMEDGFCPPRDKDKKHGEGFFARGVVDIQSNNSYYDGFCVHSDQHVEFQNGNQFEKGTTVSMPDKANLVIPSNSEESNRGLGEALASMDMNLDAFFNELPQTIANYANPGWSGQPDYITDMTVFEPPAFTNSNPLNMSDLKVGAVNKVTCGNNGSLPIDNNEIIEDVVIVTDCDVKFGNGSLIQGAVLATTSTSSKSVQGSSGFQVGNAMYCSDGEGGATILTMGAFSTSSSMKTFGSNIIAMGDIGLTAGADGLGGVNFMAGGRIDVTSNSDMGFCNFGPPKPFSIPVFRMVM